MTRVRKRIVITIVKVREVMKHDLFGRAGGLAAALDQLFWSGWRAARLLAHEISPALSSTVSS